MTAPTQAQREAAKKVVALWFAHLWTRRPDWLRKMPDQDEVDWLSARIAEHAAAQVGETRLVGLSPLETEMMYEIQLLRKEKAATIERCVQVAEQWEREGYPGDFKTLLTRIRKLKDET